MKGVKIFSLCIFICVELKDIFLLHLYGDCTMASLTNNDVYLVYCDVDMPINSKEEPTILVF